MKTKEEYYASILENAGLPPILKSRNAHVRQQGPGFPALCRRRCDILYRLRDNK